MSQSGIARFELADEAATVALAGELKAALPAETAGWVIALSGELGAGKSTFARALLRSLGHDGPVPSPTYTLIEPYELPGGQIYHVDLYRIVDVEEIEYLGFSDLGDGLLLVEWPERAPAVLATADILLSLQYQGAARAASMDGQTARGRALVERLGASANIK